MQAFISYCHADEHYLKRLHVHLANLRRQGQLKAWHDREIDAGSDIDGEIERELEKAGIFLLLVSPDFINSNYCIEREMKRAMEKHENGDARVIPIIVEPCDWKEIPELKRLKALPKDGEAVSEWTNENNAFLNVVEELRLILASDGAISNPSKRNSGLETKVGSSVPRFRIKRDFDAIDRAEFRDASFTKMRSYFEKAVAEVDALEGLRARYVDYGPTSFGCTIINSSKSDGIAHITVHRRSKQFSLGDIYYSFSENASANSANGGLDVTSNEFELFLCANMDVFGEAPESMNDIQAAEFLWKKFIENAGITYA